jgi:hypothetical protein
MHEAVLVGLEWIGEILIPPPDVVFDFGVFTVAVGLLF